MKKLLIAVTLATAGCTSGSTLDERAYLGMNAGYQFGADTIAVIAPTRSAEQRAEINNKRAEVFKALCKARLAYNLANAHLNRVSTPRCVEALGPNPSVTGYDAEILTAGKLLDELRSLLKKDN